jgi:carboxyl-terminal processing protease
MMNENTKRSILLPFILGIVLAGGIFIGSKLVVPQKKSSYNKISDVLDYIQQEYVDTINRDQLTDKSIEKILEQLDPHSAYIPASELQAANEPLEGNFEGIGIEFHLQEDSIMVVSAIAGGPSEQVGLMAGDRIVQVDGKTVVGKDINNEKVMKLLRGKGGSKVKVGIYRRGHTSLMPFTITRGKIPIYSIEVAYMVNATTGYIKLSRFAATTYDEFMKAAQDLEAKGMKQMILDLRGNPGGYLDAATSIADEFLAGKKLIVYTQGKARPRTEYNAHTEGTFETGKVVVLIDEGSASASEILSGALQDWDRATIVGRRSFGKGLVQEQTPFPDGSAIRLTIARYYTPTGRSIQKPYQKGVEAYEEEVYDRVKHGELLSKDSIHFVDSLKYKTPGGKIVYGGGGIMPDVFVPMDTSYESDYLNRVFGLGLINQFAYDYVDQNRTMISAYTNAMDYRKRFNVDDKMFNAFIAFAEKSGVKKDEAGIKRSGPLLKNQLKAYIARLKWQNEGLYPVLQDFDKTFNKGLEQLK